MVWFLRTDASNYGTETYTDLRSGYSLCMAGGYKFGPFGRSSARNEAQDKEIKILVNEKSILFPDQKPYKDKGCTPCQWAVR